MGVQLRYTLGQQQPPPPLLQHFVRGTDPSRIPPNRARTAVLMHCFQQGVPRVARPAPLGDTGLRRAPLNTDVVGAPAWIAAGITYRARSQLSGGRHHPAGDGGLLRVSRAYGDECDRRGRQNHHQGPPGLPAAALPGQQARLRRSAAPPSPTLVWRQPGCITPAVHWPKTRSLSCLARAAKDYHARSFRQRMVKKCAARFARMCGMLPRLGDVFWGGTKPAFFHRS